MMSRQTTHVLPAPAPGTRHELTVFHYGQSAARPKAYLQAALHADEIPGLLVLHHLLQFLEQAELAQHLIGEIVVVPYANPIGLNQQLHGHLLGRFDFVHTTNFNRRFPEWPTAAMVAQLNTQLTTDPIANTKLIRQVLIEAVQQSLRSKPLEAWRLALLELSIDADIVLDLHCDQEALLHVYASSRQCSQAEILAAQMGAAVLLLEEQTGGMPFDEANAGTWWKLQNALPQWPIPLACFAATIELRGRMDVSDVHAQQDAFNLYRYLQRQGVIDGSPGDLPNGSMVTTSLTAMDVLTAPQTGVLVYHKALGEQVRCHEKVAEVIDVISLTDAARTPIYSRTDGLFFVRALDKLVRPGHVIGKVAGSRPLAHRLSEFLLDD